jgi:hypothetical protein
MRHQSIMAFVAAKIRKYDIGSGILLVFGQAAEIFDGFSQRVGHLRSIAKQREIAVRLVRVREWLNRAKI